MALEDDAEPVQAMYGKKQVERRNCHVCHIPMNTLAENRIGVHVKCVYDVSRRRKIIPEVPSYGRRRPQTAR